ncbi:hypothetical protein DFH29DRAFT_193472 [Suillus ampliporus]|nr:hypothetical protein DFH29DRAFT_193472 [Suillus ampliporus]
MLVTSSSFYDPTQASGFPAQQSMHVWDAQFTGPGIPGVQGGEYFTRQQQSYQQPYTFEATGSTQYSFAHQPQGQQQPQRPVVPAPRRSTRGGARTSAYYRQLPQGGAQGQQPQYPQLPQAQAPSVLSIPISHPSLATSPTPSSTPALSAANRPISRRTAYISIDRTRSIFASAGRTAVYISASSSHFTPPPTQTQFQIQQTQFPPSQSQPFSQTQSRPQGQFTHVQPLVQSQSIPMPNLNCTRRIQPQIHQTHIQAHTQSQPQVQVHTHVQGAPNPPQQSQHYSPSDSYYLSSDVQGMYYAINAQGSQSLPSLHSTHAPVPVPASTPHAHSMSPHSPFASFGPHTPPTNSLTPSSDGGHHGICVLYVAMLTALADDFTTSAQAPDAELQLAPRAN